MSIHSTRVAGGVLAAVLVGLTALTQVGTVISRTETRVHSLDPTTDQVRVSSTSGDIAVAPAKAGTSPDAQATLTWAITRPEVTVTQAAGRAELSVQCPGWGLLSTCSVDWLVQAPTASAVEARTTSGDIELADLSGPVTVETSSGDVDVRGVSSTLSAGTTSGNITVRRAHSRRLTLATTSGDVDVALDTPPDFVEITVTSGSVTLVVPDDGVRYDVVADATSGEVVNDVGVDPGADRRIVVHSTSGDVAIRRA